MIKIGLIGCGGWASSMHTPALAQLIAAKEISVAAVCDIKQELADKTAQTLSAKAYTDANRMLDNEQLDAVSILSPTHVTESLIENAIQRGLPFLTEKPPVTSAAKQKEFVTLVGSLPHVVAYNRRFAPYSDIARKWMEGHQLQSVSSAFSRHKRFDEQFSNTFVHGLDFMLSCVGPVNQIQANISDQDKVTNIALNVRGNNDCLGQLLVTPNAGAGLEHYQMRSATRYVDIAFPQFGMHDLPGFVDCFENNELKELHDAKTLSIDDENMAELGGIVNEYRHLNAVVLKQETSRSTLANTIQTQEIREWLDLQESGMAACTLS